MSLNIKTLFKEHFHLKWLRDTTKQHKRLHKIVFHVCELWTQRINISKRSTNGMSPKKITVLFESFVKCSESLFSKQSLVMKTVCISRRRHIRFAGGYDIHITALKTSFIEYIRGKCFSNWLFRDVMMLIFHIWCTPTLYRILSFEMVVELKFIGDRIAVSCNFFIYYYFMSSAGQ